MNFSRGRSRRIEADVSVTPLIDLFLNILVFFLVATTFASDSIFYVDLPDAKPGEKLGERKAIVLNVDIDGHVSLDRKLVTLPELATRLSEVPEEKRKEMPVVVRADRNSKHGSVVNVIDAARSAGLQNIGIVTQNSK